MLMCYYFHNYVIVSGNLDEVNHYVYLGKLIIPEEAKLKSLPKKGLIDFNAICNINKIRM